MKMRFALLFFALLLPIVVAIVVARFALPGMVQPAAKNSTPKTAASAPPVVQAVPEAPRKVPQTLDEAKQMTIDRLLHLQKLSQAQWEAERKAILYRHPPETIEGAIARAQLRLGDLNRMKTDEWIKEKERLLRDEQSRLSRETKK